MTCKDRMLASFRRKSIDHVPFCTYNLHPYLNSPHAKDSSYKQLLSLVEAKAGMLCKISLKQISGGSGEPAIEKEETSENFTETFTLPTPKGDLRSVHVKPHNQPGMITEHYIKTDDDIDRYMSIPWQPVTYDISQLVELERQLEERGLPYVSYEDPMYAAARLFNFEDFVIRCITQPKAIKRLIDHLFEQIMEKTHCIVTACKGHDVIFYCAGPEIATPPMLPPRIFAEMITPYQKRLIEIIHNTGQLATIHCHGRVREILAEVIATGADALEPIEPQPQGDISLSELLNRTEGRLSLMGHIQDQEFYSAIPGTMSRHVEKIAELVNGRSGYVMSPTCTPFDFPATEIYIRNYTEWIESAAYIFGT